MDRIGYRPWMEDIGLQFTSVLWSMPWQKLKDSMEDDSMINMLIDPYQPSSSPIFSHHVLRAIGCSAPGISIREGGSKAAGGTTKDIVGPSHHIDIDRED